MTDVDDITVELRQGNQTVARLVHRALEQEGFVMVDGESDDLADLLIADVDSEVDVDDTLGAYVDADKHVLISGLRRSRDILQIDDFLERPFSMQSLIRACRKACGLDVQQGDDEVSPVDATNEDIFMDDEPEDLRDSGPTTREMEDEEAGRLEEELGLQSGKLRDSSELAALQGDHEAGEAMEIDSADSIVLNVDDIEEIEEGGGGKIGGDVQMRAVDIDALQEEADQLGPPPALSSSTASQTMPDAPAVKREQTQDTQADSFSGAGSSPREPRPTTGLSQRRRSSHGAGAGLPDQLVETLSVTADLIAEHWNAVSLAARPSDRAERIERVVLAALRDGPSAAEDELRRIPVQDGFSGSLGSWGLRDVLMVLIFRRLRGRLEVSVEQNDYVLFIDRGQLDEIENLAGDNDRLLLDSLRDAGAIDDPLYSQLEDELAQELSAPLEMKLRSGSKVDNEDIQGAKRSRARHLFSKLVAGGDKGWFAFMQVGEEHGHSWPVNPLELALDELMSQNSDDTGESDERDEATVSSAINDIPQIDAEPDPATREVPAPGSAPEPEPAAADASTGEGRSRSDSAELNGPTDSASFQGKTRESAPWEIEIPPEAEPSEAEDDGDESASKGTKSAARESDAAARESKKTVESGASDISLPDNADDVFGDSHELDDLLKSVIEDSDAEND